MTRRTLSHALVCAIVFLSGVAGQDIFTGTTENCTRVDRCPPIEIIFMFDTSGSMVEEGTALCNTVTNTIATLNSDPGLTVLDPLVLSITQMDADKVDDFYCIENAPQGNVLQSLYPHSTNANMPGPDPQACRWPEDGPGPTNFNADEAWGPGSAVLAGNYPWTDGTLRIVVPLSDESPCNDAGGDNYVETDLRSVENAIAVAQENGVILSPVQATGNSDSGAPTEYKITTMMALMATQTGGKYINLNGVSGNIDQIFTGLISEIIEDACNRFVWNCDDRDPCTIRETCVFNETNPAQPAECIGICICDNNCEEVSSFSVPEDDIDVAGDGNEDDGAAIGAGVGAGVVGVLFLVALLTLLGLGILLLAGVIIVVVVLQVTGVTGSSAAVVAHAFIDGGANVNPMYEGNTMENSNPLFE